MRREKERKKLTYKSGLGGSGGGPQEMGEK